MKHRLIAISTLALLACSVANAQLADDKNVFNHLSIGASVGTTGWGVELGTTVCPFVGLRVGYEGLPKISHTINDVYSGDIGLNRYSENVRTTAASCGVEDHVQIDAKTKFKNGNAKVLFDLYPTRKTMFHFTVGAYIGTRDVAHMEAEHEYIAAVESYNDKYAGQQHNGETMPKLCYYFSDGTTEVYHENGKVEADLRVNKVKPYIGFGVGRTVPRKRIGCMFEAGIMYWGKPKLYNGGNDISDFDESKDVMDVASKIPVYPVLKFRICGRIF